MNAPKGLRLSVYRNPRYVGCGGVGDHVDDVTLIGVRDDSGEQRGTVEPLPRESRVFEPAPDAPAVILVYRKGHDGTPRGIVHVEPYLPDRAPLRFMAGGGYVSTSDSRFGDLRGFYGAVSFHDRCEQEPDYWRELI